MSHALEKVEYSWYRLAEENGPLEQGEIIMKLPLLVPTPKFAENAYDKSEPGPLDTLVIWEKLDSIVITQTCDIANKKVDSVLVCPITPRSKAKQVLRELGKTEASIDGHFKDITKGKIVRYFALNECNIEGVKQEISFVDFGSPFTVPIDFVTQVIGASSTRLQLRSPFREAMAHAFAFAVGRVAIPLGYEITG